MSLIIAYDLNLYFMLIPFVHIEEVILLTTLGFTILVISQLSKICRQSVKYASSLRHSSIGLIKQSLCLIRRIGLKDLN